MVDNANKPVKIKSGDNGGGKGKHNANPLLDPNYGYKTTKTAHGPKEVYTNPHGLGPILGSSQIQGVLALFGNDTMLQGAGAAASIAGGKPFTANQVMYMFDHADPATRANIQNMMYQAGNLYDKKYIPSPGAPLTKQDRDAFKKFMIGVAANPSQGGVGDLLNQAAQAGGDIGAASAVYKPLVEEITNPDDIKHIASQVGLSLHNTFLSPDQLTVFTAAYNTMEKAFQEKEYAAQGGDLATGMVNPNNATGATVTKPAELGAGVQQELEDQIRQKPEFATNTFADRLNTVLASLRGPTNVNVNQVGPV